MKYFALKKRKAEKKRKMFAKIVRYSFETVTSGNCVTKNAAVCSLVTNRIGVRFQSNEPPKVSNSSLYHLRKATGYALSKCKEALEKNNGNVEEV